MRSILVAVIVCLPCLLVAQVSNFIHVDQFGYAINAEKVAVLSDPQVGYNSNLSYSPPNTLEVKENASGAVVFTGTIQSWGGGATHSSSGDRGWWFDFSSLTDPGEYYVFDPQNQQKSAVFVINENPYVEVLKAAGRMFYYNRCNFPKDAAYAGAKWSDANNFLNPLQDANCRYIFDPANSSLEKDLRGGWFDAGDYNKYVTFAYTVIHNLCGAYDDNPDVFTDSWDIPESGNGIPDIIDELKWELDWLLRMTNSDGSVHIKMGSQNYSENTSSPPSLNTDQRFYGPTCTSASAANASMLARAALTLTEFPSLAAYADNLKATAEQCFAYTLPFYNSGTLETGCDNGEIIAGDADMTPGVQRDWLVTAAIYLFELTGDPSYSQFVASNYNLTEPIASGFWGVYKMDLNEAMLRYAQSGNGDPGASAAILAAASNEVLGNFNGYFGWVESDLYRSQIPDWSYHWGSSKSLAEYGNINELFVRFGLGDTASLKRKSAELLHYFHGVNPLGIVYLSNMYDYGADRSVNEIYHTWFADGTDYDNALTSPLGPAPGYVSGGPNPDFTVSSLVPPYGQPDQKSYLDFNTSWPDNSWEISEPAIYYQASYLRLLSNFVSNSVLTGINDLPATQAYNEEIRVYPNPVIDELYLKGAAVGSNVQIMNVAGQLVGKKAQILDDRPLDISGLSAGVYIIRIQEPGAKKLRIARFVKL